MRKTICATRKIRNSLSRYPGLRCAGRVVRSHPQPSLRSSACSFFGFSARGKEEFAVGRALRRAHRLVLVTVVSIAFGDEPPTNRATVAESGEARYNYVGTKKCRSCHGKWHRSWEASAKGRSWNVLSPGIASGLKRTAGLDPENDFRTDTRCLKCHSTGFGHPTGYAVPDPDDGRSLRRARKLEGVGCEACHGPGSGFVEIMRDVFWNKRSYTQNELRAAGLRQITREDCLRCHAGEAPCIVPDGKGGTHPSGALDVDLHDRKGFHETFSLRYRASEEAAGPNPEKINPSPNKKRPSSPKGKHE